MYMSEMTRRKFLKLSAKLAALTGLSPAAIPKIAEALNTLSSGQAPLLWLQGQSCSGCSVSLLNSEQPDPVELLTGYISLRFHSTLSTATGDIGMQVIHDSVEQADYVLVIEGSIPAGMPEACMIGNEPFTKQVLNAADKAAAIIAVGTCAAFGGIPAAENNPTGALSVPDFLKKENVSKPVISIPGCPVHPDWLVGTLVHVLKFGIPELDDSGRPKMFFGRLIHDQCPRFADYEREKFARTFSDEGCLFKLGCMGPNTHSDCTNRLWNSGTSYCIKAGAPCIGCTSKVFASKASFPFFRKNTAKMKKEVLS
jgi:hydrogenase small subunit